MDDFFQRFDAFVKEVETLRDAVGVMSFSEWFDRMNTLHTEVDRLKNHFTEDGTPSTLNERSYKTTVKGEDFIAQSFNLFKRMMKE